MHPSEYGEEETPAHGCFDRCRDAVTLPLIRACVERGQPFLGICRGFQEVNVALGGTLHPEIRDLPGRMNHRMPPDGTIEEKFALRHPVRFVEGGVFHRLMGAAEVMTNTLHGQGIGRALLRDAVLRVLQASEVLAVRGLLVQALNPEAQRFYLACGFTPSPAEPMLLMATMTDLTAALG